MARIPGVSANEAGEELALPSYQRSPLFSDVDKLVLDYAVGISRTPVDVPDELFARLRERFDDAQLVQLTHLIALENMRGRFNLALGIGSAGFSEGMVCAVPERAQARAEAMGSRYRKAVRLKSKTVQIAIEGGVS